MGDREISVRSDVFFTFYSLLPIFRRTRMTEKSQTQLNRRVQEIETLYEIGKILTSELKLEEVLKLILQKALELTDSKYGTLGMLNEEKTELTYNVIIPEGVKTPPQKIGEGITGRAAKEKKTILVSDVTAKDSGYIEVFPNMKSELAVPMIFQDKLIGVLNVESPNIGAFDENNQKLLEALADFSAIDINNARLFDQTDKKLSERVKELEALQHIDEIISSVLNLEKVLELILNKGVELIAKRHKDVKIYAMIQSIDKSTGELVIKQSIGVPEERKDKRAKIGEIGITGLVAKEKKSLLIRDVTEERWKEWYIEMIPGVRSELAVPLLLGDEKKLIGIFNLESPKVSAFDEDDKRLIESLSRQAVIAIHNAEQFEIQNAIYEIGKVINSTLDIKEILGLILDKGLEKTGAHSASARLLEERELLVAKVRRGLETEKSWNPIKIGEGIVGYAAKEKKTMRIPDVNKDRRYLSFNPSTKSEIAVPILNKERELIGVFNFEHSILDAFDEDNVKFIELLSGQASIAIQKARQYQELQEAQDQLSAANTLAWLGIVKASWMHDITQKVNAIRTNVYTLEKKFALSKEVLLDRLKRIDEDAEAIIKIAPDLPSEDVEEEVSIDEIFDAVIKKCNPPLKIKVNRPKPSKELTRIIASNTWLTIAFEHIIKNALRAMPEKGKLTIICKEEKGEILIEVSDTGGGIPEKIKSQLFKNQVRGAKGNGVGLLLVKTILLKYGGNIKLTSTGSKGTTFTLYLPIKRR
ncbi:MAG: GAF domain-containing protein [bacterium]